MLPLKVSFYCCELFGVHFIIVFFHDIINNGNKWTIEAQSVDDEDGHDRVHLNKSID